MVAGAVGDPHSVRVSDETDDAAFDAAFRASECVVRFKATLQKSALPRHMDVPLANQSRKWLIRRERVRIHFGRATTEEVQDGLVQCCLNGPLKNGPLARDQGWPRRRSKLVDD
jgi:hypothetical protein